MMHCGEYLSWVRLTLRSLPGSENALLIRLFRRRRLTGFAVAQRTCGGAIGRRRFSSVTMLRRSSNLIGRTRSRFPQHGPARGAEDCGRNGLRSNGGRRVPDCGRACRADRRRVRVDDPVSAAPCEAVRGSSANLGGDRTGRPRRSAPAGAGPRRRSCAPLVSAGGMPIARRRRARRRPGFRNGPSWRPYVGIGRLIDLRVPEVRGEPFGGVRRTGGPDLVGAEAPRRHWGTMRTRPPGVPGRFDAGGARFADATWEIDLVRGIGIRPAPPGTLSQERITPGGIPPLMMRKRPCRPSSLYPVPY